MIAIKIDALAGRKKFTLSTSLGGKTARSLSLCVPNMLEHVLMS